ncbi:MAG: hypothetical protein RJA81_325 [Planctomycetota bacterium]
MTLYSFDDFGWLSDTEIEGRQTAIEPPPASSIPDGHRANFTGYSWVVLPYKPPPPPILPDFTEDKVALGQIVYQFLNQTVQQYDYQSIDTACLRALSTNPVFKAQGEAAMAWRDAVDATCEAILTSVRNGERPVPQPDELIAELPILEWPS